MNEAVVGNFHFIDEPQFINVDGNFRVKNGLENVNDGGLLKGCGHGNDP
jgi:hypothetical protein